MDTFYKIVIGIIMFLAIVSIYTGCYTGTDSILGSLGKGLTTGANNALK